MVNAKLAMYFLFPEHLCPQIKSVESYHGEFRVLSEE
jgi:hypothetical protein